MADLTPYPTIPGGYAVSSQTASDIKYTFLSKQQSFEVNVNGLLPSTRHFVFFENKRVANTDLKPLNGTIGDVLYTDADGKISFVFYYKSDIQSATSEEVYADILLRTGGDKELVVASSNTSTTELPESYENIFTSYAKKNIFFKTTKVSELLVKSNYAFAYPPALAVAVEDSSPQYEVAQGAPLATKHIKWVYDNDSGGIVERSPYSDQGG